ncbi:MOSC domain-containing protein [Roseibium algae]|uniref:Molybdenum cofactor sulfurase n=1 Tax=Roseibium algae TaxID=3123038 RepID=A0ABU8TL26_9HYPH
MTSSITDTLDALAVTRARKLTGSVSAVLKTPKPGDFPTLPCDALDLGFEGIDGDRHGGFTRKSGGREPWYPRGTEMCNERQLSLLCPAELALVAQRMELDVLEAAWIGGNLLLDGFPNFSLIPPRTRLVFEGGVVIRVDGDNAPCRSAGKSIAKQVPEREGLDLLFPKVAKRLRGLVGYVEKPGTVRPGESVTAVIPEQWIYDPA